MFEIAFLQAAWFLLVGVLLLGYAVLDGFDLGVGMQHLWTARTDEERQTLMTSIGPVWDGNEVWLITAGGALFAAFPKVYATVFSGFYLALMLVLAALILRAVSLEFRTHVEDARWRAAWDVAFWLGSLLPAILFGVAIGNILRGLPLDANGDSTAAFVDLVNPFSLLVGLLSAAMFLMQGGTWLVLKTEGAVAARARLATLTGWVATGALWLLVTGWSSAEAPDRWSAFANPLAWLAPAGFVIAMALVPILQRSGRALAAFLASSGAIAGLLAILGIGLYPNLVPSTGVGSALTAESASSSQLTLTVMLIIAVIGMPIVLAYTAWVYRTFRGKVRVGHGAY